MERLWSDCGASNGKSRDFGLEVQPGDDSGITY